MDGRAAEMDQRRWRWWPVGLAVALLLGAGLRLIWVQDMEYKLDEAWTFDRARAVGETERFPWVGMLSSVEIRHPGMSIWVFLYLGKLSGTDDPTQLARACQLVNIAAILLLVVFALRAVPRAERESWLWATALVCLNPLAVLMHRKIWPPSILPLFTMMLLVCWWYRDRRWGALAWGLAGAILGQIHPAGFFFAAASRMESKLS